MDREKFERYVRRLHEELIVCENDWIWKHEPLLFAKVKQVMHMIPKILPDHSIFFDTYWSRVHGDADYGLYKQNAINLCFQILELLQEEMKTEEKIDEGKIFEGAKDKLKSAEKAFRKDDWTSVMNNLNSSVELALKDKLGIPTTLSTINTNKIIEVLVKHKIEPVQHLKEAQKYVLIDNKVKHQGYKPDKIECVNAMKSIEELLHKLDKVEMKIEEDVMKKIYGNL